MTRQSIKIHNPTLDDEGGDIIIRGTVDPDSLSLILVGTYQREALGGRSINDLKAAAIARQLPEIDLGMRGENFRVYNGDTHLFLQDDVYVIDGLQRINASLEVVKEGKFQPLLSAVIRLNTTVESEKTRFEKLNVSQRKVSPNILLRNLKEKNPGVEMLYNLSNDKAFAMKDRIAWQQVKKKSELITAASYTSLAVRLHMRVIKHSGKGRYDELARVIDRVVRKAGKSNSRHNMMEFFNIVNSIWNIESIHYKDSAIFMRMSFLSSLALLFARHKQFWRDDKLHVDAPTRKKLAQFPLTDPHIKDLTSTGGTGIDILYNLLVDHVNKGKTSRRLVADI